MKDGIVSRYLNRRLHRPLAAGLAHTPLTPNAATAFSLGMAALVVLGQNVAGQLASIIDGVDGDLARLTGRASRFRAALDAIGDRYADAAILGGMTIYAARFEEWPQAAVGGLALAGALTVSYSRARVEAGRALADRWSVVGGDGDRSPITDHQQRALLPGTQERGPGGPLSGWLPLPR